MRHPLSMLLGPLLYALTLTLTAFAQTTPASAVEVAYVLTSQGIQVYDVDRQTGIPTFEGLAAVPLRFISVVPSADDHFVYVYGTNAIYGRGTLYVYQTDSTAMLRQPAIQELDLPNFTSQFTIHPNGRFGSAVVSRADSNEETDAGILLFALNPATGRIIGSPRLVATYPPNSPCGSGWSVTGSLGLIAFSPDGNRLYDDWYCVAHDDNSGYYYTRWVDQKTGTLGPDMLTFSGGGGNGSFSSVLFTPRVILNYYISADYNENTLDVYPLTGGNNPLFSCTADMLPDCSAAFGASIEPSGN